MDTKVLLNPKITVQILNEMSTRDQLPETFGIQFTQIGADFLEAELVVDHRHLRPGKIMNGGVSLVLIETVGSMSAACVIDFQKQNALGVQVSANHLAVAKEGDKLTARSQAVHIGKTTHVWNVVIRNQHQKVVCDGRITLLITQLESRS